MWEFRETPVGARRPHRCGRWSRSFVSEGAAVRDGGFSHYRDNECPSGEIQVVPRLLLIALSKGLLGAFFRGIGGTSWHRG